MMTHTTQTGPPVERCWWSPLVESLPVAMIVLVTLQPASLVAAGECLVNEESVPVQGIPSWKAIIPTLPAHSVTMTRDCLCGLFPYLDNSRFVLGKRDNFGITALTACLGPSSVKPTLLARPPLGLIRQVNPRMQPLRVSIVSYSSKKQMLKVRTPLPEIIRSMNSTSTAAIIGPVQEFQNSPFAEERSMTGAIPSVPPPNTPSALFGDYHWSPFNQFKSLQQLPNGESHRMNMTTASALHGRDCVSDCP